jgi:hypothetical protein
MTSPRFVSVTVLVLAITSMLALVHCGDSKPAQDPSSTPSDPDAAAPTETK